jgi:hypothetical protein
VHRCSLKNTGDIEQCCSWFDAFGPQPNSDVQLEPPPAEVVPYNVPPTSTRAAAGLMHRCRRRSSRKIKQRYCRDDYLWSVHEDVNAYRRIEVQALLRIG